MNRYTNVMIGGISMATLSGVMLMVWLELNTGSGVVGLLYISGVIVGLVAFGNAASASVRDAASRSDAVLDRPHPVR